MKFNYTIIHRNGEMKLDDSFSNWISASSLSEAKKMLNDAYPTKLGYEIETINIDETNK
jgi:hypothetical protein